MFENVYIVLFGIGWESTDDKRRDSDSSSCNGNNFENPQAFCALASWWSSTAEFCIKEVVWRMQNLSYFGASFE